MILLSVIMSVKDDNGGFLKYSIESILNQTFKSFELIIIADGSNKSTLLILDNFQSKYKNIRVIKQENKGLTKSLNTAINHTTSELILRHDYDDISSKSRFFELYNFMEKNKDVVICATNCFKIDKNNRIKNKINIWKKIIK